MQIVYAIHNINNKEQNKDIQKLLNGYEQIAGELKSLN